MHSVWCSLDYGTHPGIILPGGEGDVPQSWSGCGAEKENVYCFYGMSPAMLIIVGRRGRVILGLVLQLRKYRASRPLCMS